MTRSGHLEAAQAALDPKHDTCEPEDCPGCGDSRALPTWVGSPMDAQTNEDVCLWTRCTGCGLVRLDEPMPGRQVERIHGPFPEPPTPAEISAELLRHDTLIMRIRAEGYGTGWIQRWEGAGNPKPRLLDIGSGWGTFLAAADWRGFDVLGVERAEAKGAWARRHLGVEVHDGDAATRLPEGLFDVICAFEVLNQVEDPHAIIQAASDQLVPQGLLAVSVPAIDHPAHRAQGHEDPMWRQPSHRTWFDRETLASAMVDAALQPVGCWYSEKNPGSIEVFARKI